MGGKSGRVRRSAEGKLRGGWRVVELEVDARARIAAALGSTPAELPTELALIGQWLDDYVGRENQAVTPGANRAALRRLAAGALEVLAALEVLDDAETRRVDGAALEGWPYEEDPPRLPMVRDYLRAAVRHARERRSGRRPKDAARVLVVALSQLWVGRGRKVTLSRGAPGRANEGCVTGPFWRFLEAVFSVVGEKPPERVVLDVVAVARRERRSGGSGMDLSSAELMKRSLR